MQLLSNLEAAQHLGVSVTALWRLQRRDPKFPKAIRVTGPRGRPRWDAAELDRFLQSKRMAA